jgi:sugar/nucleoside kinase (ribokinase family)
MQAVQPIYQKKIDREALLAVNKAKNIWQATPNKSGADQIAEILASVDPLSASYEDAVGLTERVRKKIEADEKRDWDFKIKKYTDSVKLAQQRIEAARQIAISFYQNQPSTIIYNRLFW